MFLLGEKNGPMPGPAADAGAQCLVSASSCYSTRRFSLHEVRGVSEIYCILTVAQEMKQEVSSYENNFGIVNSRLK